MWTFHTIERVLSIKRLYTAFSAQRAADFAFRGETHDFYELVLLTEGRLGVTAGAESFVLEAPAAVLHPPMEFHSLHAAGGTAPRITIFTFAADPCPVWEKRIFALTEEQIGWASKTLSLIQDAMEMKDIRITGLKAGKTHDAQRAALALEDLLLSLSIAADPTAQKEGTAAGRNYRRALRVIEENLTASLNTAELARLAHMSPSLLKKTFARHAGVGVMEYFRARKVNAAIPMLRDGSSIQEIAAYLGFTNAGYFSTVFRRVTGHTPSYYRNH